MAWNGQHRRIEDALVIELSRRVEQLQSQCTILSTRVEQAELLVNSLNRTLDRGRTVVLVVSAIGVFLGWIETQYRTLSGYVAYLLKGGP